jgi:hypothetical protein
MEYDLKPYLKRFFMGPFQERSAAILGASCKHGECSMVVGTYDGAWWVRPWPEENYHEDKWPVGFNLITRREVGVARVKNRSAFRMSLDNERLDTIRSLFGRRASDAVTEDFDFDFADWLDDADFDVKLPFEDVRMAANIAGDNDDVFFRILSQYPICPPVGHARGDSRK